VGLPFSSQRLYIDKIVPKEGGRKTKNENEKRNKNAKHALRRIVTECRENGPVPFNKAPGFKLH
jgi:hypothetical protein